MCETKPRLGRNAAECAVAASPAATLASPRRFPRPNRPISSQAPTFRGTRLSPRLGQARKACALSLVYGCALVTRQRWAVTMMSTSHRQRKVLLSSIGVAHRDHSLALANLDAQAWTLGFAPWFPLEPWFALEPAMGRTRTLGGQDISTMTTSRAKGRLTRYHKRRFPAQARKPKIRKLFSKATNGSKRRDVPRTPSGRRSRTAWR